MLLCSTPEALSINYVLSVKYIPGPPRPKPSEREADAYITRILNDCSRLYLRANAT